jgi:WD40 repeat protein
MVTKDRAAQPTRWAIIVLIFMALGGLGGADLLTYPTPTVPVDLLPTGAVAQFGSARLQHSSIDRGRASFSPDSKRLVTIGTNGPTCLWDADTGKLLETYATLGTSASLLDLRWKPDGKLATLHALGDDAFVMQEFVPGQKADPQEIARLSEEIDKRRRRLPANKPEPGWLKHSFLSYDGQWAVAVRRGGWADVYRFMPAQTSESAKPAAMVKLPYSRSIWQSVSLSTDGKCLLVSGASNRLLAFKLTAEDADKPAWELSLGDGHKREPVSWFSLHGQQVVIHFYDGAVELWDGPKGKRLREFPKVPMFYHHLNGEWGGVDLSADGKRLALLHRGTDGLVGGRILDVSSGKELCVLTPQPMPQINGEVSFSPDGRRVARVGCGVVRIWNADTGADACPLPGHRGSVTSLVVAGNGQSVVTMGADFTVRAWNPNSIAESWHTAVPEGGSIAFVTADAVVVCQNMNFNPTDKPTLRIDLATGQKKPLPGKLGEAKHAFPLAVSPDGKSIVTLTLDPLQKPTFEVWSWPAGQRLTQTALQPPDKFMLRYCAAARFSPDGKQFIAVMVYDDPAEWGGISMPPGHPFLERWDLATGKLLSQSEPGKGNWAPRLLPYRKGLLFWLTGNHNQRRDDEVRDGISGRLVVQLQYPEDDGVLDWGHQAAALSADGQFLAIGETSFSRSCRIIVFELATGKVVKSLRPGGSSVDGLQFLADGRLISFGYADAAIVWSAVAQKKE